MILRDSKEVEYARPECQRVPSVPQEAAWGKSLSLMMMVVKVTGNVMSSVKRIVSWLFITWGFF